jgi:carbamate kinase
MANMSPRVARTAVLALGGNAITAEGQAGTETELLANCRLLAKAVVGLVEVGWRVVVTHGNGPQVGNLSLQQSAAEPEVPGQPLSSLVAMTQGWLGGLIELCLRNEGGDRVPDLATMITHVAVDPHDPAFSTPTKPIGPFYPRERAEQLATERGWTIVEDSGRGFRRVVASPRPVSILQSHAIGRLVDDGFLVIAAGGGGVAVTDDGSTLHLTDAVVDKDRAAAILAAEVDADALVLVTGVDAVQLDFGTCHQRELSRVSADEMRGHLADGQFPAGSMGPKVEAAVSYLDRCDGTAVITSAGCMAAALGGRGGTRITRQRASSRAFESRR